MTAEEPHTTSSRASAVRIIGLDIVGPLVIYRVGRSAGMPQVWALVVSGASPGVGVLVDYLRWRTLEVVGAFVLAGIALSVLLAVISGSPKAVLLEGAGTTGAFGAACLLSLAWRRPVIFYFVQGFYGGRHSVEGIQLDSDFTNHEEARYFFRTITVAWGIASLLEAAALAVVVQSVSTGTALAFNRIMPWVVNGVLFVWSLRWGNRLRAQRPQADETVPEPKASAEHSADQWATKAE
jgi:hypothetical protein